VDWVLEVSVEGSRLDSHRQPQLVARLVSMVELVVPQPNQQAEDSLMAQLQLVARCSVPPLPLEEAHSQVV